MHPRVMLTINNITQNRGKCDKSNITTKVYYHTRDGREDVAYVESQHTCDE